MDKAIAEFQSYLQNWISKHPTYLMSEAEVTTIRAILAILKEQYAASHCSSVSANPSTQKAATLHATADFIPKMNKLFAEYSCQDQCPLHAQPTDAAIKRVRKRICELAKSCGAAAPKRAPRGATPNGDADGEAAPSADDVATSSAAALQFGDTNVQTLQEELQEATKRAEAAEEEKAEVQAQLRTERVKRKDLQQQNLSQEREINRMQEEVNGFKSRMALSQGAAFNEYNEANVSVQHFENGVEISKRHNTRLQKRNACNAAHQAQIALGPARRRLKELEAQFESALTRDSGGMKPESELQNIRDLKNLVDAQKKHIQELSNLVSQSGQPDQEKEQVSTKRQRKA